MQLSNTDYTRSGWVTPTTEYTEPYTCTDGEIIDIPVYLADTFRRIDQRKEDDRLAFCAERGLDPETFTGCHNCQGVGRDREGAFCWCCDYGADLERRHDERTEREFQERFRSGALKAKADK